MLQRDSNSINTVFKKVSMKRTAQDWKVVIHMYIRGCLYEKLAVVHQENKTIR